MKNLFLIDDSAPNKISFYHIVALLATLPFDLFYSHLVFVSFALHTLLHLKNESLKKLENRQIIILQSVFFIVTISLIYTHYFNLALADVTRLLAIFLFPIFFALTDLDVYKYRDKLLKIFSLCCFLTVGYLYLHAFWVLHYFRLPFKYLLSNNFISHNFSLPIGMHATFFSLQIAVALFFTLSKFITGKTIYRWLYLVCSLFFFAGIIQLGSKAVLIAVFFSVNVAVPYFLITAKKRVIYIPVAAALTALVILGTLHTSSFMERYFTDFKKDLSTTHANEVVEPRLVRWQAAMALVKQSPVIGYGAGAELNILRDEYFNRKLYSAFLNKLNAHNQYITFMLITGLVGLLVYLFTLGFGFITAIQQNDLLFFVFIALIAIVSLSESLLNAEKGIWFYAFFFSFFLFSTKPKPASTLT